MDVIFNDGEKVINQESMDVYLERKNHGNKYKTEWELNADYNIYGDDYKIEISGDPNQCIFVLKDYDEHQIPEYRTAIVFREDELSQLIAVLESVRDKM